MLLPALLDGEPQFSAIWYEIIRQSPYAANEAEICASIVRDGAGKDSTQACFVSWNSCICFSCLLDLVTDPSLVFPMLIRSQSRILSGLSGELTATRLSLAHMFAIELARSDNRGPVCASRSI